jgi:hypothetical protein
MRKHLKQKFKFETQKKMSNCFLKEVACSTCITKLHTMNQKNCELK